MYFGVYFALEFVYAVADLKRENSVKITQILSCFFLMTALDLIRTHNFD